MGVPLATKFRQVTYRVNKQLRQTLTSSSIVEGVASPGLAEDGQARRAIQRSPRWSGLAGDPVISVDREKHMEEREEGVRTLVERFDIEP